jgi:hypothetical protein
MGAAASDKRPRSTQLAAGKLVDGRPAPTMTVERARLAGGNRTAVGKPDPDG